MEHIASIPGPTEMRPGIEAMEHRDTCGNEQSVSIAGTYHSSHILIDCSIHAYLIEIDTLTPAQ